MSHSNLDKFLKFNFRVKKNSQMMDLIEQVLLDRIDVFYNLESKF